MNTRTKRARLGTTTLAAVALTGAAALAGCGHPATDRAGRPAPSPAVTGLPAGVVNATAVPTAVPNDTSSRRNVTISSCRAAKGGWQAAGTAANPGGTRIEYTVTVFFTTAGGTVIGTGQTRVGVQPGAHQAWNVTAAFHPAKDTRCVLRGVG